MVTRFSFFIIMTFFFSTNKMPTCMRDYCDSIFFSFLLLYFSPQKKRYLLPCLIFACSKTRKPCFRFSLSGFVKQTSFYVILMEP